MPDKNKLKKKKKMPKTIKPGMLGAGSAESAAEKLRKRRKLLQSL